MAANAAPIIHPRAKEFERDRAIKQRKANEAAKKLRQHEDNVMRLGNKITHMKHALGEQNEKTKALRLANSRLQKHHQLYEIDHAKHPSDRAFDVRVYTKMDNNVWEYSEMRNWYNKDASKEDLSYKLTPADTGYMVKIDPDWKEPNHANYSRGNTPREPVMWKSTLKDAPWEK